MTQKERIIEYMKTHNGITSLDALLDLGVARLGARIYELKRDGLDISTEFIEGRNRYGQLTHYALYKLV